MRDIITNRHNKTMIAIVILELEPMLFLSLFLVFFVVRGVPVSRPSKTVFERASLL